LKNVARSGEAPAVTNAEINTTVRLTNNEIGRGHACVGTNNFGPQFNKPSEHVEKSEITADVVAGQSIWAPTTGNIISAGCQFTPQSRQIQISFLFS
jgi:hypothetical protein